MRRFADQRVCHQQKQQYRHAKIDDTFDFLLFRHAVTSVLCLRKLVSYVIIRLLLPLDTYDYNFRLLQPVKRFFQKIMKIL